MLVYISTLKIVIIIKSTKKRQFKEYISCTVTICMTYDYDAGTLRCRICAMEFPSKAEAETHYKEVHSKEYTSVGE